MYSQCQKRLKCLWLQDQRLGHHRHLRDSLPKHRCSFLSILLLLCEDYTLFFNFLMFKILWAASFPCQGFSSYSGIDILPPSLKLYLPVHRSPSNSNNTYCFFKCFPPLYKAITDAVLSPALGGLVATGEWDGKKSNSSMQKLT